MKRISKFTTTPSLSEIGEQDEDFMAVKNFGSYVLENMNLYVSSNFKNPHDHRDRRQLVVYPSFQDFNKILRSIIEGYFWEKRRRAEDGKIVYVPCTTGLTRPGRQKSSFCTTTRGRNKNLKCCCILFGRIPGNLRLKVSLHVLRRSQGCPSSSFRL